MKNSTTTRPLAVLFGGSRGIGAACVKTLLRDGFDVAYTATQGSHAPRTEHGGTVACYAADVRDPQAVATVFAQAERDFDRPASAVVVNAGINRPPAPIADFPADAFRELVEVNIVGAFNVLQEAARRVADGGAIVGITTSMVRTMAPGGGPYTASKAAVESLLRSMSRELAARRVRVNGVAPGPVDTELFHAGKNDDAKARAASMSPFNRIGEAGEVAEVVSFLVSARASWVHGQIVQPNGGMV